MTEPEVKESILRVEMEALQRRVRELEAEVAELERTRLQLRHEHSFRKGVIEHAAEGICVCHAIDEYPFVRFSEWNHRMDEITGYSVEEINRLGWYQTVYPDPEVQERARRRMIEMREGKDLQYERWEISRADGERRILGISTSILKSDDGLIHVLAMMHDATDEERYRRQLERRVNNLEGILPICASCKRIRDDEDVWHPLEVYMSHHSGASFSHVICPECTQNLYPDLKK